MCLQIRIHTLIAMPAQRHRGSGIEPVILRATPTFGPKRRPVFDNVLVRYADVWSISFWSCHRFKRAPFLWFWLFKFREKTYNDDVVWRLLNKWDAAIIYNFTAPYYSVQGKLRSALQHTAFKLWKRKTDGCIRAFCALFLLVSLVLLKVVHCAYIETVNDIIEGSRLATRVSAIMNQTVLVKPLELVGICHAEVTLRIQHAKTSGLLSSGLWFRSQLHQVHTLRLPSSDGITQSQWRVEKFSWACKNWNGKRSRVSFAMI